jgi:16S rRNA G966 N2-methylase RsmD
MLMVAKKEAKLPKPSNIFRTYKVQSIENIIDFEHNSRTHSEEQIDEVVNSIAEFGYTNPILVDEKNVIIAGHCRVAGAKRAGLTEIPTIIVDGLTDVQKSALVIADNKMALNAGWNYDKLIHQISFLRDNNYDTDFTGFKADEIATFMPDEIPPFEGDEDEVPDIPSDPITKLGDIWIMGKHRLMCGDSTSIDAVEKLIADAKPEMVYTDPPYGIDENTDRVRSKRTQAAKAGVYEKIIGDTNTETAIDSFNLAQSMKIPLMVFWGANHYCHALPQSANWLVWDKRIEDKQRDGNSDCELAWVKSSAKSVRIFRHLWKGMIKGSEHGEGRVHPTQKPIALAEWCFNEYGKDIKSVLDLFGGSGSTLIACEKTNRKCLMMELSPQYCDVIVSRWEKFTGKKAELEASNGTGG